MNFLKKYFFSIVRGLPLVIFLFASTHIEAQEKIDYGVKFGLNLADLITDESRISPRPTFQFGAEAEYRLNESWGFQTEILYNRLGNVRRGTNENGVKFDNTLALDYINIPLLANFYISEGFYVGAGPQIGFLVKADQEETVGFDSTRQSVASRYNNIDFSGVLSIGYLTEWGFNVGLRYQLGLIDVLEQDLEYTNSQRHSALQLYMSVRF